MLTRRHIRVKVMQSVYAFQQTENKDIEKQEKFLFYSIDQMHDLYLVMLQLMVALRNQADSYMVRSQKKFLPTATEINPSRNFVDNKVLSLLAHNVQLQEAVENKKINYWELDDEYIQLLFKELRNLDWYQDYLKIENPSYQDDKALVVKLYKEVIAPNDKLYDYFEDKRLTWLDDFPIVNTTLVKVLNKLTETNCAETLIPDLYKNDEDRDFAKQLFRKVLLHDETLEKEIVGKTPNWDKERIAEMDFIILKMGISEFLYFPSIPVRATINEYLEISKEYSTPKSSLFINGILDKVVKDFTENDRLNKLGRGLR